MIRKIIQIDSDKCNGCGACARACHEGAIGMVNGKARLLRDDYCDGLGDCLPACPANAICFVEREAAAYDAAAVAAAKAGAGKVHDCGCPGASAREIRHKACDAAATRAPSRLENWPVQIKLAPVRAPYFDGAELLVAADCTAYARGSFHEDFIRGRSVLIGCPKLDGEDYSQKLRAILHENDIRSVTLTRMRVPCCGALERMLRTALEGCGRDIPLKVAVIDMNGEIMA